MWLVAHSKHIRWPLGEQSPSPAAVYHPCSLEALYCSSPVWIPTLLLNLTFLPSWAQSCGAGIRNISHLLFLIHPILFRWFCTEKGWDFFHSQLLLEGRRTPSSGLGLSAVQLLTGITCFQNRCLVWCWAQAQDCTNPSSKGIIYLKDKTHGMKNFLDEEQNAQHRISHFLRD